MTGVVDERTKSEALRVAREKGLTHVHAGHLADDLGEPRFVVGKALAQLASEGRIEVYRERSRADLYRLPGDAR